MIEISILNRFSGRVQFVAEIDCAANMSNSVKLGMAIKWAIKNGRSLCDMDLRDAFLRGEVLDGASLRGANLRGACLRDTDLRHTDLIGASLRDADLRGADLIGANLRCANLRGANLRGANLSGVNLGDQWIVQGATRSDGWVFFLQKLTDDKEPMVKAGCRYCTLEGARRHWEKTRAGTALLIETRAIIRCMVEMAHSRGLMK